MTQATSTSPAPSESLYGIRYLRKDIGVAIIVAASLLAGLLISQAVTSRTQTFAPQDDPFRVAYPAGWVPAPTLIDDALLKVQNPLTASGFKTTLTVEGRDLDPAAPPTLQDLLDRRVEERQALTGYHFLSNQETMVGGQRAIEYNYTYVVQPADEPRRASLPVVVIAREYIVSNADRTYYITYAVPERDSERALAQLQGIIQTVELQ